LREQKRAPLQPERIMPGSTPRVAHGINAHGVCDKVNQS